MANNITTGKRTAYQDTKADDSGRLKVAHTERTMSAYNVTDPELDVLGVLNVIQTSAFAASAAIVGFCVDFKKDTALMERLPDAAMAFDSAINWIGIPLAGICVIIGLAAYRKRGSVIDRIKRESRTRMTDG